MEIPDAAAWVDASPGRSVSMEYRNGQWRVVFNGPMMDPVRVASARGERPTTGLLDCLHSGLRQVRRDK